MKKVVLFTMIFALFLSSFARVGVAEEIPNTGEEYTEEEIEELAKQLEIFYKNVAIKDEYGNVIDIDFDKFEEEFGSIPELEEIKDSLIIDEEEIASCNQDFGIGIMASAPTATEKKKINDCVNAKIKSAYKEYFSVAALGTFFTLLYDGKFTDAAKKLVKMGVKANIFTLGAQLLVWHGSCVYKVKGW